MPRQTDFPAGEPTVSLAKYLRLASVARAALRRLRAYEQIHVLPLVIDAQPQAEDAPSAAAGPGRDVLDDECDATGPVAGLLQLVDTLRDETSLSTAGLSPADWRPAKALAFDLSLNPETLRGWRQAGLIRSVQFGGRYLLSVADATTVYRLRSGSSRQS